MNDENNIDAPQAEPAPYVRQRAQHRSVEPINDFAADEEAPGTTHDSGYVGSKGMGGRSYRRSRAQGEQLRRDLHYGQYLEIPKGRRSLPASSCWPSWPSWSSSSGSS